MLWRGGRQSDNIEDRRGMRISRGGIAGGGIGTIILALIAMYFGIDPSVVLQDTPTESVSPSYPRPRSAAEDEAREFVSVVLADTEDVWRERFAEMNRAYQEPTLVLFSGAVESACGFAQSAMGPFYCPRDRKVYLDTSFFEDLQNRFRAPGDFAQAYVIAHEIGHHVQNLLGIAPQVEAMRGRLSPREFNAVSVMVELQADCFSGVWAHHAQRSRHILEAGDVEEALGAASAIGDDRLQRQSRGYVAPDSFTHGTSAQRVRWFQRGFETGELRACDTFNADRL